MIFSIGFDDFKEFAKERKVFYYVGQVGLYLFIHDDVVYKCFLPYERDHGQAIKDFISNILLQFPETVELKEMPND